ncbi:MAG: 50S ribosomal protein L32 [candidate division Zixibacteria bacterium 4484_93]|nr:MAG: 50S ribosomal protein L32 [candidate division Zixibacteria bacterium 4484_93]RKZ34446.1 MAG: 50S ribosomal protein L32 [bacterium]
MALPKRRHSKSRGRKRRTHWKITVPTVQECPHCHQLKLAHRICPNCGYYNGRQVVSVKEAE